ncbi:MAG: DUF5615 family PIN-like protein [Chloroflexi bacterium]|nr:DUF5615 family PIN-like protein [Chloroflexota bacterium]
MPRALAEALRRRAVDVRTATEEGLLGAPDDEYLKRSLADQRVVVTHEEDMMGRVEYL